MPLPKSDLSDKIFSKLHIGLELLTIIPYIFHKIKPFKAVRILSPFNVCLRRFFAAFPVFLTNLWEYAKMIPQIKNERLLFMAEFWDIYDEERHKTGKLHKRGLPLAEGEYHLVIHVWVRNSNGDFLITRRSPGKNLFPGKWECTGGSALVGEDSEAAALRETLEETGIDHTKSIRGAFCPSVRRTGLATYGCFKRIFHLIKFIFRQKRLSTSCGRRSGKFSIS